MVRNCRIEGGFCFLLAACLLLIPLKWIGAMFFAAAFHELCHAMMAQILGVKILAMYADWLGIQMDLSPMERGEELLIASAGPVGSFLLLIFVKICPEITVCGLVQGMFNLLPIWPLDGGRILSGLFPGKEKLHRFVEFVTAIGLMGIGIWLLLFRHMGIGPLFLWGIVTVKAFRRKIPCIAGKLRVQ